MKDVGIMVLFGLVCIYIYTYTYAREFCFVFDESEYCVDKHTYFHLLNHLVKNEEICPIVKMVPFKANEGK